jgi:hypothetical protein
MRDVQNTGQSAPPPRERPKPATPPMLRHVLLVVVIVIVVWMGYSVGVIHGFWGLWKHSSASGRGLPAAPIAPAPAGAPGSANP